VRSPGPPPDDGSAGERPFPGSLCHSCAAPPRYIRTERSEFIYCPVFKRYPPQPVGECSGFVPRKDADERP